jgi:thiosulfate/3-mercaptopyruvate sulfurtransferase
VSYATLITVGQVAPHLHDPSWVLFDCRFDLADAGKGERNYANAHLPSARYAHLDRDLSDPITPQSGRHPLPGVHRLACWLGQQGVNERSQVVVYDDSGGNMAVRLWWLLRWLGHTAVAVLDGGWQAWLAAGQDTTSQPPAIVPVPFYGTPDNTMLLSTDAVQADLSVGHWLIVDARTGERFRGEVEPLDPVAGHIPGAVNLPLQHNLSAHGYFRPAGELRAMYDNLLQGHPAQRVACMCGSGVTAVHNLLAMEVAGLSGARLYAGSWSEWIRNPDRPVAIGGAA